MLKLLIKLIAGGETFSNYPIRNCNVEGLCDLYNNTDNEVIKERIALGNQFRLVDNFREEEIEGRASGIKQFCNGTIDEEA